MTTETEVIEEMLIREAEEVSKVRLRTKWIEGTIIVEEITREKWAVVIREAKGKPMVKEEVTIMLLLEDRTKETKEKTIATKMIEMIEATGTTPVNRMQETEVVTKREEEVVSLTKVRKIRGVNKLSRFT